jgi:pilus assembly protein FimV
MDFGSATVAQESPTRPYAPNLTVDPDSLSITATMPRIAESPTPAAPAAEAGMIEFDLGALSLDLPGEPTAASPPSVELNTDEAQTSTQGASLISEGFDDTGGNPLATKLALAEEFNAIGDPDGARSLAQEVLAEASGDLKNRAQRFLAEIA